MKVVIHEIAFGGKGVGRLEDGRVVFVPFVAVGETAEIELVREHRSYLEARLLAVENPSAERVKPRCPYFGRCGGCSYQHLSVAEQHRTKRQQVEGVLRRIGRIEHAPVRETVPAPRDYEYRNRITVHVDEGTIGFFGQPTSRGNLPLVDIARCPIAEPAVNEALARFRARPWRREGNCTLRGDPSHPGGFLQTNDGAAAELLSLVEGLLPGKGGGGATHLVDAYCGVGFFARHLRDRFAQTVGIEWDQRAVDQAQRGAAGHEHYLCGDVAALLPEVLAVSPKGETLLLLDPPAEGITAAVRRAIRSAPPSEIIYVSCNPATLARDVAALGPEYEVRSVTPLDMFPQTAEIEVVTQLRFRVS